MIKNMWGSGFFVRCSVSKDRKFTSEFFFYIRAPRATGQNVAAIALDRRFLGTIIAVFKMWLYPFNQPCIRHPMTEFK